jgi:hypothetical protein
MHLKKPKYMCMNVSLILAVQTFIIHRQHHETARTYLLKVITFERKKKNKFLLSWHENNSDNYKKTEVKRRRHKNIEEAHSLLFPYLQFILFR